jgi:hypothetical protein
MTTTERPPYLQALAVTLAVLGLYILTLAPTTAFWDTSEYIAAAKVLGIPHPPGNPLFTVTAHVWGMLPFATDYAVRINLYAAVTSALSAGLWFLVLERWLRGIVADRIPRLISAAAGVLVSATAWTVWNQSTVNEKVYTVSMLTIAIAMWLIVRWGDSDDAARQDRLLLAIGYVVALGSTNHMMGVLVFPAVLAYVALTDWRLVFRPWTLLLGWMVIVATFNKFSAFADPFAGGSALGVVILTIGLLGYALVTTPKDVRVYLAIGVAVVGVTLNYVYLPMRAGQYPPINEGEAICGNLIKGFFGGCQDLSDVLDRVQYGKPSLMQRQATITAQFGNFMQYFNWQWARDWGGWKNLASLLFGLLGLLGIGALWEKDRRAASAGIALMAMLTFVLVFYMNFKYGYSQHPEIPVPQHEVRERDYFYVAAFALWGIWVGLGIGSTWQFFADLLAKGGRTAKHWAASAPVLAVAFIPLAGNHVTASRANESMARDLAHDILESVAPYGILITAGDNDTFPLWYAQEVEGIRTDVTLANLSLMNTRWHLRQLRRREAPAFEVSRASVVWKERWQAQDVPGYPEGRAIPRPEGSVLPSLTMEQVEQLPEIQQIQDGQTLPITDSLILTLRGDRYGDRAYLQLSDLTTIFLIRDNIGKRPIYFSWTTASTPDRTFGLMPYMVTEGLVRRVNPTPVRPSRTMVFSPDIGFVDLEQTDKLLWNVYHVEEAARQRPRGWVDPPSASILSIYALVYGRVAPLYLQAGDSVKAMRAAELTQGIQANLPRE